MIARYAAALFACAVAGCGAPSRGADAPGLPADRGCPSPPPSSKADPRALAELSTKRIAKTCFYGLVSDDPLRADLRSRAGRPFDLADLREDVRKLMASERFEDVEVSAIPDGYDAVVFFRLRERPRVSEVTFEGALMLQKEGLEPKISPAGDKPIALANVYDAVALIRDEYRRRGYREAAIDVVPDRSSPSHLRLKVVVKEGPQSKYGPIRFSGVGKAADAEVRKASGLEQGAFFDDEKVVGAARSLEEHYLNQGFLSARVTPSIGERGADGTVPITFDIVEGEVVRFGAVTIGSSDGKPLSPPTVSLRSKQGATYSAAAVAGDVEALLAAFVKRGDKVVVVPRRELDPSKRTLNVVFQVARVP